MQVELPSLNPFHEKLCSLDFFKDFKDDYGDLASELEQRDFKEDEKKTDEPMELEKAGEEAKKDVVMDRMAQNEVVLHNMPLSFESSTNYIEEWERLFFLEIKAQILRNAVSECETPETYFLKEGEWEDNFFIMTLAPKET